MKTLVLKLTKTVLVFILLTLVHNTNAQTTDFTQPTAELINTYNDSQKILSKGDFEKAIEYKTIVYNQSKDKEYKILGALCAYEIAKIYATAYSDYIKYIYWLKKADGCEFPYANGLLGDLYLTGASGVEQDFYKAKCYYEKSEEGRCKWILATMFGPDGELGANGVEFLKYCKQAAEKGFPDAQYNLGLTYYYGRLGIKQDIKKGEELIKMAAKQNQIDALRFINKHNVK